MNGQLNTLCNARHAKCSYHFHHTMLLEYYWVYSLCWTFYPWLTYFITNFAPLNLLHLFHQSLHHNVKIYVNLCSGSRHRNNHSNREGFSQILDTISSFSWTGWRNSYYSKSKEFVYSDSFNNYTYPSQVAIILI